MKNNKAESQEFHLYQFMPNVITMVAFVLGITAIHRSFYSLELSVIFIMLAAFLDLLDGRLARALNASSDLGKNMDSLSDLTCFGIAPAFMVYNWKLYQFELYGWFLSAAIALSVFIRLARFNTQEESSSSTNFEGVPSPAAGGLAIAPIAFEYTYGIDFTYYGYIAYYLCLAFLTVSHIPTISTKKVKLKKTTAPFLLILIGMMFNYLSVDLWGAISLLSLVYIAFIPIWAVLENRKTKVAVTSAEK